MVVYAVNKPKSIAMKRSQFAQIGATNLSLGIVKTLLLLLFVFAITTHATAQHAHNDDHPNVALHVNSELGQCDFDISSDLTQAEWKRASREIGNTLYLDPLSSSAPLGRFNWSLQLESNSFTIDQESGAWNNTFHHPDSAHYLTDNSNRLFVPALRFRMGLTDRIDFGFYYTSAKPFGANYGFLGVEGRYAFLQNIESGWSATVRGSYVMDANVKDFNLSSTGIDVTASKTLFKLVTPYAGAALNWNRGKIISNEVSLSTENTVGFRGLAGIDFCWKFVNLGYEVQFGDGMQNRSFKIGVRF